jgi:hypothetical protein
MAAMLTLYLPWMMYYQRMADDKKKRKPQDSSKVNVNEAYEVTYWCDKFGCTAAQLKAAVKKVGVSARAVEKELERKK